MMRTRSPQRKFTRSETLRHTLEFTLEFDKLLLTSGREGGWVLCAVPVHYLANRRSLTPDNGLSNFSALGLLTPDFDQRVPYIYSTQPNRSG